MKKSILVIVVMVVAGLLIYGFKDSKGDIRSGATVVKVGVIAPLTGPLAEYGEAFRNGIMLAQEKTGNKNIQFIFEDSAYDSGKTISAYTKLKTVDNVNVLFNWGDPTSEALAPLLKNQNIPFFAFTSVANVTQTSPYTIRMWNRPEDFAQVMWSDLRSKNLKNVAVVKVENLYLNSLLDALIKAKNPDEKVTLVDNYLSFGDKDFRTSISKIKKATAGYDVLGVYLASGQIGQFYKQVKQQGLSIPTFGTDFFENQSDIDVAGNTIDGAVYANYDVTADFKTEYKNRFGNVSQIAYAGNAYDAVIMMNKSINLSNKDSILKSLESIKDFSGVLGNYSYKSVSGDRYLASPIHIKQISGGEIKSIK